MSKKCEKCGLDFKPKRSHTKFCYRDECKKDRQKDRWKKWYAKEDTRLKVNKYQQRYRYTTKNFSYRNSELKAKYGIGIDRWEAMLEHANYACEICGKKRDLVYDHCHKTNVSRGVLCRNCNAALGNFKDDRRNISRALTYLKERQNGIPALMDRIFSEDVPARFEQGCLFTETGGGDSYVTWQSADKRRVQWHKIWRRPLR